jgi:hypothetical protein
MFLNQIRQIELQALVVYLFKVQCTVTFGNYSRLLEFSLHVAWISAQWVFSSITLGSWRSISFRDIGCQKGNQFLFKCLLARQELEVDAQLWCYNDDIIGVDNGNKCLLARQGLDLYDGAQKELETKAWI